MGEVEELRAQLAETRVIAGEAMAWVELLRPMLVDAAAQIRHMMGDASPYQRDQADILMPKLRAVLAECEPSKPGHVCPQPLAEARAEVVRLQAIVSRIADEASHANYERCCVCPTVAHIADNALRDCPRFARESLAAVRQAQKTLRNVRSTKVLAILAEQFGEG